MKPWSTFYPDVQPAIIGLGIPNPLVDHAARRATQEFCRLTRAWCVDLDATTTSPTAEEYDLELPNATELVALVAATINDEYLEIWKPGDRDLCQYVESFDGRVVTLKRNPAVPQVLRLRAALQPGDTATGIEDFLAAKYADEISRGIVARLKGDNGLQEAFRADCRRIMLHLWRNNATKRPRPKLRTF